ncbi:serine O-acetyltransferase [Pararoseomonas indoligenes]|uniref:Serine acetyltransferase n=1 Tax=Roseomonas indoligenes TaxID=2820811 RepID=A0A940MWW8_9PROT|nr:serine O-acetyltransferase [Pararoseomonas indoligenes]MBP0491986.1 serine O-acetyltransferase [Pararoseomonas indoligenes]
MDRFEIDTGAEAGFGPPADPEALWVALRAEAARAAEAEPALRGLLELAVLRHDTLHTALAALLARKLAEALMPAERLEDMVREAGPALAEFAAADLSANRRRDPAARGWLAPFLYYKGFHALTWHRVAHGLWLDGRHHLALYLQSRCALVFGVDIHPAVPVGRGVFIDHATGVVVGETAMIGNDVSILQGVTLGGTGKERGDRHPKVRDGVLLSAGATVLGNIEVGRGAKVGAGSVVLASVPPCATVAGVPARVVGWCRDAVPALAMDQSLPSESSRSA